MEPIRKDDVYGGFCVRRDAKYQKKFFYTKDISYERIIAELREITQ